MDTTRMLGPGDGFEYDAPEAEHGHNPLLTVHLLLQGRYWLAILAAVILAAVGAGIGYKSQQVLYASTGTIHVRPVISSVLFDKSGAMPMYESFVQTQIGYIKSERCIDIALLSPQWLNNADPSRASMKGPEFTKHLDVVRDGEFVHVTYSDPDPKRAADAVAAVINAYQQLIVDLDPDNAAKRQQQLEQLKTEYETKLQDAKKRIADAAAPYTPDSLTARYGYKNMESNQAETEYKTSRAALENWLDGHPEFRKIAATQPGVATAPASAPATGPATAPVAPEITSPAVSASTSPATKPKVSPGEALMVPAGATLSDEEILARARQIALYDARIRGLLQTRDDDQAQLDEILSHVGPNNPTAVQQRGVLAIVDRQIKQEVVNWKAPAVVADDGVNLAESPEATFGRLASKTARDYERWQAVKKEVDELETKVKAINVIDSDMQQTQSWLEETKQKLEEARVEAGASGRILILSTGDLPVMKDKRLMFAAGAGFGGCVLGFALVLLLGLTDRRVRTIDQARMTLKQGMRVLGMLPSLPKNLEDPSAASFAALCVHHIRMLLQVMPRLDGHPSIAVTSPSPGDGKTSLTLALALSYAASGRSTLLIDCDIVGAGLTRRVNALIRRRIGQILIRENLITPAELREALSAAQRSGRKLGEVLVDEGYVDADQLAKALQVQGETSVGLLDVMRGEVLEDCVADTGTPRLWILPVGSAVAEHGATISPEGFRAVLEQARKRFEVVLVDTGPIPGSIESSVACSQVDGVVMTVSRGEQGPLVKRASEHLHDIGARALGIVFNRAKPEDFSSSYGSMSSPSIPERVRDKTTADSAAFGPVAAAVAGQQKALKS